MVSAKDSTSRTIGRPIDEELQARRRVEILTASTEVFAARGFAATDVQEIANRIGVGKGTVYRYFPSKEELFLAAVDNGMKQLKAAVELAADSISLPWNVSQAASWRTLHSLINIAKSSNC